MKRYVVLLMALGLILASCTDEENKPQPTLSVLAAVKAPGQPTLFTHGGDSLPPRPPGLVAQLPALSNWPCEGDGTTGRRVQAIYAHGANISLTSATRTAIEGYARYVEGVFLTSAQATGGSRLVRFVTDASCNLSIVDVTLSANALASFDDTISELSNAGLNRPDRIYHAWTESSTYCGIGTVYGGDAPTGNYGETVAAYSRTDNGQGCWAYGEAHELVHNMGGVQLSAPHTSGGWHCNDEFDLLCYADGGPQGTMTYPCSDNTLDARLDCNHDDFFSTSPPAGSYLATHWNVANSSALSSSTATTAPPSSTTSTVPPSTTSTILGTAKTTTNLAVPGTVRSGTDFTATATVTGSCSVSGTVTFIVSDRELSKQVLVNGVASVTLRITGGVARPTIRSTYGGNSSCSTSTDTARPRLK